MTCKLCGLEHRGWVSCAKAKHDKLDAALDECWRTNIPDPPLVANLQDAVANAVANKHGVYADKEKRRAYMRELMRKRRSVG